MCGIVAAVAARNVVSILLEGLRRLEYRGYDSAGVAVAVDGTLKRLRSAGRVAELTAVAEREKLNGSTGIAHTRWATHGEPSEKNAHPHVSAGIAVVHNGIIENHEAIRTRLRAAGYQFTSDTDTEVIAHLIQEHLRHTPDIFAATRAAVVELTGAFAIAVISEADPGRVIVARQGAPLLLGVGDGEMFAASDASALLQVTRRMIYLEEGDIVDLHRNRFEVRDRNGNKVDRPAHLSELTEDAVDLGPYRHYMQKEIFEQPGALANTLEMVVNARSLSPQLFGVEAARILSGIDSVLILACGTSYHAGVVARYWIESLAGLPCSVEIASEYRYRASVPNPRALVDDLYSGVLEERLIGALTYEYGPDGALTKLEVVRPGAYDLDPAARENRRSQKPAQRLNTEYR